MRAIGVSRQQYEALRDWVYWHLYKSEHSNVASLILDLLDVAGNTQEYCPQCAVHEQTITDLEETIKDDLATVEAANEQLNRYGIYEEALTSIRAIAEETLDDH